MDRLIELAGHLASYGGALTCLVSAGGRLFGFHFLAGYSMQSLFIFGMAAMIFACLAKLHTLTTR